MLSDKQVKTMLSLQASMNSKVDTNWVQARYPYLRAVVIEGSEAIEHHGWKWWKKQAHDLPQLQMELVDIWHFILSEILLKNEGNQLEAQMEVLQLTSKIEGQEHILFDAKSYALPDMDLLSKLELLIGLSAARRIDLTTFSSVMKSCDLSWTELFCQYVGKNVLNFFRQDNGYKQGTYQKIWNGREDNEYLVEIMAGLDPEATDFQTNLYEALASSYPN
jgi:dimeric dUTPase (all-alpha-NTP-PPase superfamily)